MTIIDEIYVFLKKHHTLEALYNFTPADFYREISVWLSEHGGRTEKPDSDEVGEIYKRIRSRLAADERRTEERRKKMTEFLDKYYGGDPRNVP